MKLKTYINKIAYTDKKFLNALSKVKILTKDEALEYISKNRLEKWQSQKVITTKTYFDRETREYKQGFIFTKYGKEYCSRELPEWFAGKSFYASASDIHDLALSERFSKLSEFEKENSFSEGDSRNMFNDMLDKLKLTNYERYKELYDMRKADLISPPDFVYKNEETGQLEAIEIFTEFYKPQMKLAKDNFCKIMNMKLEKINI